MKIKYLERLHVNRLDLYDTQIIWYILMFLNKHFRVFFYYSKFGALIPYFISDVVLDN